MPTSISKPKRKSTLQSAPKSKSELVMHTQAAFAEKVQQLEQMAGKAGGNKDKAYWNLFRQVTELEGEVMTATITDFISTPTPFLFPHLPLLGCFDSSPKRHSCVHTVTVCFFLAAYVSCHIISYHIISYHIISYHIISYHIISYHIISYHIISYHIISYHRHTCFAITCFQRAQCNIP